MLPLSLPLPLQTSLLSAWCDTLTLLQAKWGATQPSAADAGADAEQQQDSAVQEQFGQLLHEEVELLNELLANDRQLANSSACTAALPDPGPDALAQGDPMEYLRRVRCCAEPAHTPLVPDQWGPQHAQHAQQAPVCGGAT